MRLEHRDGGWYVVEYRREDGFEPSKLVARRTKVPILGDAPRERAEYVARQMGLIGGQEVGEDEEERDGRR